MADCKTCEYENVCEMPDFVRNDLKNCKVYEPKKKQTNADRIRAMSDEDLAEWIYSLNHYFDNHRNVLSIGGITMEDCITDISEWLKREVEQ